MLVSAFSACAGGNGSEVDSSSSVNESVSVVESEETETSEPSSESQTEESEKTETSEQSSESQTEESSEEETELPIELDANESELILLANKLSNGVQAYYSGVQRPSMILENLEMSIEYGLIPNNGQQVLALKNSKGVSYVENTMDVFLRMTDGSTHYASTSDKKATSNLYRIGYYYYETRYEEQDFLDMSKVTFTDEKSINHTKYKSLKQLEEVEASKEGIVLKTTSNTDPFIVYDINPFKTADYGFIEITMSAQSKNTSANVFVIAGDSISFSTDQCVSFELIPDGEQHTYIIPICRVPNYNGKVTGLRLDIGHGVDASESTYKITSIKLLQGNMDMMPLHASMNRSFLVYSDKMHQLVQIATTQETEKVAEVGISTVIDADTVAKLLVKDASGEHDSIDGIDWAMVEYIGFDIKDAGIFGYILPFDGKGGQIKVSLSDGKYIIEQTVVPKDNKLIPSVEKTDNANDLVFGSRVYTDESHDFEEFKYEAFCERNPLGDKKFNIPSTSTDHATYIGYDSLRGIHEILPTENNGGFNSPFFQYPNRHIEAKFAIRGDDIDRRIYLMTRSPDGCLECAVLLDSNKMMLPVPLEVLKNFSEAEGERNLFNIDDSTYGEVIFPLVINAGQRYDYTVAHLYQNWGNYPLKQLSGIQFRAPYYHLSTGVTESNCIVPWYSTKSDASYNTLPDFRSMSAPLWSTQPQHNSCGDHYWLDYTDIEGNRVRSENFKNVITSYGPTYAEIEMDYISGDGKIAVKYTHMEMPQTDENRTYYTMEYTVLEDVSIKDFKNDFAFYYVNPNDATGLYKEVGYLNENNECVTTPAKMGDETAQYVLGDECPYFSFFNVNGKYDAETNPTGWSSTSQQGYSNVGFLVYNSSFVIGGEECEPAFVLTDKNQTLYLSLNLGEVALKAGDRFTINAILLPWGSQELDNQYGADGNLLTDKIYYDTVINAESGEMYKDKSVRNVREDTLLDPLKVTAVSDCEVIESVYLPKIKTTNGNSAEFTLSGGENNVVVKAYGFSKLTAPRVYEKIDGDWVEIELYSANNPDKMGYCYYYDGYSVQYDGDGTFSYSFVVDMTGDVERTFKIEAFEEFEGWPTLPPPDPYAGLPLDIYFGADDINTSIKGSGHVSSVETLEEDGVKFVRFYGKSGRAESYFTPYTASDPDKITGHYLVLKYRLPKTNSKALSFEFFVGTENVKPTAGDNFTISGINNDGLWHVMVIDVAAKKPAAFIPSAEDGAYRALYFRLDYFNTAVAESDYMDIAYIGMCDTIEEICELNKDMASIRYIGVTEGTLDPATGAIKSDEPPVTETLPDSFGLYMNAEYIYNKMQKGTNVDLEKTTLAEDKSFTSIALTEDKSECFVTMATPNADVGRYAIIKYRMNTDRGFMQIYTSTANTSAAAGDVILLDVEDGRLFRDDEWHVVVVDLTLSTTFSENENGEYVAKYIRIDPINTSNNTSGLAVDFAYIAIASSCDDVFEFDGDIDSFHLVDGNGVSEITKTAE